MYSNKLDNYWSHSRKVAIVYDRVNKWGGAERVLLSLNKIFPDAHLYTSVLNLKKAPWAKNFKKIETSFLQNFPFASSFHQGYATLMPIAFESFSFDEYDLVISITSEAAKGIITKPGTLHICYCLTPTRYLWSGYEDYFENPYLRFLSKPAVSYLRTWDKISAQRPDAFIAISKEVQKRIKKYYGRDSKVIYPPIDPAFSSKASSVQLNSKLNANKLEAKRYFLVVSRLVPYKKLDIAIAACNELGLPLKIAGTGSQERFLKSIAGPTIEFLGELTDESLNNYYKNCRGLIFPGKEDFGLVMAEAQGFGKPVIAFGDGGALEIIEEGKTGEFFEKQTPDSLKRVLVKFNGSRYNIKYCIDSAQRFSFEKFEQKFTDFLNSKLNKNL